MRARISSKGQLVIPQAIREARGMTEGVEVEVVEVPGGVLLQLAGGPKASTLDALVGCTGYRGPPKSLAAMTAAIRRGAKAQR